MKYGEMNDADGWRYAITFSDTVWVSHSKPLYNVRKRRWVRHMKKVRKHASGREVYRSLTNLYRMEVVVLYENERRIATSGFESRKLLPTDPYPFCDERGSRLSKADCDREVNNPRCVWKTPWLIQDFEQDQGWKYAFDFSRPFNDVQNGNDWVRRRRWVCLISD